MHLVYSNYTLHVFYDYERSRDSSVSTVTRPRAARPEIRTPAGTRDFLFSKSPDRLWRKRSILCKDYRAPSPEVKRRGVRMTIHIPPVLGLRMCIATPPLPYTPSWRVHGLHVTVFTTTTFRGFS